jgi:hypothetical protein
VAALLLIAGAAQGATILVANLTVDQEPGPPVPTTASGAPRPIAFGTATFTLNDAMDALSMMATVFNIDVTGTQTADPNDNLVAAHIHASSTPFIPPATAGVVWGFFGAPFNNTNPADQVNTPFAVGVGGMFMGTWNLNEGNNTTLAAQLPNILAGRSYINFHTTQFTGGEIRGAISAVPEPSTAVLFGIGIVSAIAILRRRRGK